MAVQQNFTPYSGNLTGGDKARGVAPVSFGDQLKSYSNQFNSLQGKAPTIPGQTYTGPQTMGGYMNLYTPMAQQAKQNSASGRQSKIASAMFGGYTSSQPGQANFSPSIVKKPGDGKQDWQRADAPTSGVYSGVYGTNKNPFNPTNIFLNPDTGMYATAAQMPAMNPFERVTGKNLGTIAANAQQAANAKNGDPNQYANIGFGSYNPLQSLMDSRLNLDVPQQQGGPNSSIYGNAGPTAPSSKGYLDQVVAAANAGKDRYKNMLNASNEARSNVWQDNPFLYQDTQAYMMAHSPKNIGATSQFEANRAAGALSPQQRAQQIVDASASAAKSGTYGQGAINPFAANVPMERESAEAQAQGLYAMGMPGSQGYAPWMYGTRDQTPHSVTTTGYDAAQQLGQQISRTGQIFQRDYGKQAPARKAAQPLAAPAAAAPASLYAAKEPTRGGKLARLPKGPAIPQAAPVQQRYALQGGGGAGGGGGTSGSALLDELRKTRTGLMQ